MNAYKILFRLLIIFGFGFYAMPGYSLALSEASLNSHLNELLDVRIALKTNTAAVIDDLTIGLKYSAEYTFPKYRLKYELLKSNEGPILKITSDDFIRAPIVEFILDMSWSDGHIIRKYSFLIDPPQN